MVRNIKKIQKVKKEKNSRHLLQVQGRQELHHRDAERISEAFQGTCSILHYLPYQRSGTDALRFVFLELGRFNKRIWEIETVFDKWMYLLRHMHEMEEIPEKFSDPLFKRLFLLAEIGNFTAEEYQHYQKSLTNMGDYDNIINTAVEDAEKRGRAAGREEGLAEGEAKGLERGREEGKADTIVQMLRAGVSADIIAEALGLSVEEVEAYSES